jgi:hypothetical protein
MNPSGPAAVRGVLSGDGTAMVHALVFHHPTPQRPPDSLTDLADPILGTDGRIHDWQLSMRTLLAHRDEHVHAVWSTFGTWRRSFVADRVLGDVATVAAFMAWADTVRDVQTLHPLNLGDACIDAKTVARVAWEVHEVELACRARAEMGLGISVPQRAGLIRGFVVGDEPLLVLAEKGASVSAVRSGLEVTQSESADMPHTLLVRGWVVDADGITAISDEGPVPLGGAAGGRLLTRVAPGAANASVGPAPLTSVFSGLMLGLRESAQLASSDHIPLWIRRGNVGSARYVVR